MPISSNTRTGKMKLEKEGLRKENVTGTKNHELKRLGQGKTSDKESLKSCGEGNQKEGVEWCYWSIEEWESKGWRSSNQMISNNLSKYEKYFKGHQQF